MKVALDANVLVAALATRGACAELFARVLALAFPADVLVSGDEDLLVLNPWMGIPIVRPREFWPIDRAGAG